MGSLRHARHINVRSQTASILDSGVEMSSAHLAGALSPARITRVTSFPRWLTLSIVAIIPSPPIARLRAHVVRRSGYVPIFWELNWPDWQLPKRQPRQR